MNKAPWTDQEIDKLKALVSSGVSANRASVIFRRPLTSVRRKALELGVTFESEWHQNRKRDKLSQRPANEPAQDG
jgi:hypothetical protein